MMPSPLVTSGSFDPNSSAASPVGPISKRFKPAPGTLNRLGGDVVGFDAGVSETHPRQSGSAAF
jgi:hypothetical protein